MKPERRQIEVWADWQGLSESCRIGVLTATPSRGKEVFAFAYDDAWLAHRDRPTLDPALALYRGAQYAPDARDNFGAFLDSSPDRWGRVLMRRREAHRAREEGRGPRTLLESDYLLGVFDGHRSGGLRYRIAPEGPFLDDDAELASPPWTSLRELEHISRALEREGVEDDPSYGRWLKMLLAPGRSLGGARPKASVRAPDGELWIAKFPSSDDPHDIGAWEWITHTLATRAGIVTSPARCQRFGPARGHHTFLTQRFDRHDGQRRHFASALTMLEKRDGDHGSYLELAELIAQRGLHPARDLEQLWRRICFSVCVSNLDDHLRNHGFLLEPRGWTLAPAFDLNPVPLGDGLTLDISETDNAQDLDLVREVAPHFRIKPRDVTAILTEVMTAVRSWPDLAISLGLTRTAQDQMARAFRVADGSD